jgi:F-type H+-transporting ATPase subunit b
MTERRKILVVLFLLPFFIFMASAEEEHKSGFIDFLGKTINFIVLFGGLAYLLRKPIGSFLEKRSQDIQRTLKETEASRKEAEQKLQEAKAHLAGLEEEIEKMRKEADVEGHRERERTLQLAQKEAEKIRYFTGQEIEMLTRAGIQELKEFTAELAASLAEERIRKKMTLEDHTQLIDKSIERLSELYEESNSDKKIHPRAS